jgi:hypothetical protein
MANMQDNLDRITREPAPFDYSRRQREKTSDHWIITAGIMSAVILTLLFVAAIYAWVHFIERFW